MKWVKVAIGAVIAIMSIGIIATSVYGMTQGVVKEEVVTFEVLTETTVTAGTYDLIDSFVLLSEGNSVINLKTMAINNTNYSNGSIHQTSQLFSLSSGSYSSYAYDFNIDNNDEVSSDGFDIQLGDIWVLTFEVTQAPQLSGISATLILLAPLIFAGGVLAYLLNKQNY